MVCLGEGSRGVGTLDHLEDLGTIGVGGGGLSRIWYQQLHG